MTCVTPILILLPSLGFFKCNSALHLRQWDWKGRLEGGTQFIKLMTMHSWVLFSIPVGVIDTIVKSDFAWYACSAQVYINMILVAKNYNVHRSYLENNFSLEHYNHIISQQSHILMSLYCFKSHCFGLHHLFARKKWTNQIHSKYQREKFALNLGKIFQAIPVCNSQGQG